MLRFHLTAAGLSLAALTLWLVLDDWARTLIFHFLHSNAPFYVPVLIIIALIAAFTVISETRSTAGTFLIGGAVVVATVATIAFWVTYNYQTKRVYLAAVEQVTDTVPDFVERGAYPVAQAQAKPNLGDVRGTLQQVRFVTDGDTDSFNALVTKPGMFTGYQVVQHGDVAPTGQGTATTCAFSETATRRIGGHLSHSLDRAIANKAPGTFFAGADTYGYCDGDTPYVVVPLKKLSGFVHVTEVPAGVAVYDGHTGTVEVLDDVKEGDLPGPVYPTSLAATVRSSTQATGTFWDYMFSRAGYESTDGDEGDPNAGNTTEFALRLKDSSEAAYVTPLTPKGSAQTIVAVGVTSSSTTTSGQWNTFEVHKLTEPRKPGSTVDQRLRGDYGDLPEWAAGMKIFEITPLSQTQWVASLGQNQDVSYRVLVNADGSSCLQRADGSAIRCGKATGTSPADPTTGTSPGATVPGSVTELEGMSDTELADLQRQLTDEILTRLNSGQ